jgi:hypothetical protein
MKEENQSAQRAIVTDIHMPFLSMVTFMVKWAIAAFPALLILAIFVALLSTLFSGAHRGP